MMENQDIETSWSYPVEEIISYKNDKEYRSCIRRVFSMVCKSIISPKIASELDETTLDEYNHDQETMAKFLDRIYENTIHTRILQDLYKKAAAFLLSEDPSIGLAILFSYDYFELFHFVLCDYFQNKTIDQETPSVMNLQKKMTR
jgi:hypothetical protein